MQISYQERLGEDGEPLAVPVCLLRPRCLRSRPSSPPRARPC